MCLITETKINMGTYKKEFQIERQTVKITILWLRNHDKCKGKLKLNK